MVSVQLSNHGRAITGSESGRAISMAFHFLFFLFASSFPLVSEKRTNRRAAHCFAIRDDCGVLGSVLLPNGGGGTWLKKLGQLSCRPAQSSVLLHNPTRAFCIGRSFADTLFIEKSVFEKLADPTCDAFEIFFLAECHFLVLFYYQ